MVVRLLQLHKMIEHLLLCLMMGAMIFQILEHVAVVEVEGKDDFPKHILAVRVDEADKSTCCSS